jgi:two-component system, response regulator, stage 0 sporulation protein F
MIEILYVDDEVINLDLFEYSFRKDFIIHKSLSAEQGLQILERENIGVLISDLKMPNMNGIEFIRLVKKKYPRLACILLTGYYEPQLYNDPVIQALLFKYLLKPFKKDELKNMILEASKIEK